jgi:hypothetical protein
MTAPTSTAGDGAMGESEPQAANATATATATQAVASVFNVDVRMLEILRRQGPDLLTTRRLPNQPSPSGKIYPM